ncbi:hypothetical protein RDI58_004740 [Solanum bulbocastanum]|uniref:Uncharacterized protein n=1 Tax=Solanum bulbocastanum TaxID=147425 RepID=A0AAN8U244_SOLBU
MFHVAVLLGEEKILSHFLSSKK